MIGCRLARRHPDREGVVPSSGAAPSSCVVAAYADDVDARVGVESLDFLYTPSRDVAADVAAYTAALDARLVFAIEDGGIRVAMVELSSGPPAILLTDHVEGERPILVYRVADLSLAVAELRSRGWLPDRSLAIPPGPVASFRSAAGHRFAFYQLVRPGVLEHFAGRRDF